MFAIAPTKRDEVVVIWGGNFVTKVEAETARAAGKRAQQIDDDLFDVFDYSKRGDDPTYYHNHSCDPNTWFKDEVTIVARRDIDRGKELTLDYAMFEAEEDYVLPWDCVCGSPLCRRQITGKDWRLPSLQNRYKSHFLPMINRRIAGATLS